MAVLCDHHAAVVDNLRRRFQHQGDDTANAAATSIATQCPQCATRRQQP